MDIIGPHVFAQFLVPDSPITLSSWTSGGEDTRKPQVGSVKGPKSILNYHCPMGVIVPARAQVGSVKGPKPVPHYHCPVGVTAPARAPLHDGTSHLSRNFAVDIHPEQYSWTTYGCPGILAVLCLILVVSFHGFLFLNPSQPSPCNRRWTPWPWPVSGAFPEGQSWTWALSSTPWMVTDPVICVAPSIFFYSSIYRFHPSM